MLAKFSVLLSVYHKENPLWFAEALESIWTKQTLKPDQIVLVEDGPIREELEQVVKAFSERCPVLTVVPLAKNVGLGKALNEGMKHCQHDIVARMDTDDISHADRFEKQIAFMVEHDDVDVLSSWIQEFSLVNGERTNMRIKKLPCTHEELYTYGKARCPINHPVCVYRKSKVQQVGGYGVFPEDYYLWSKMMMAGCTFHNMQECLLDFRVSGDVFKRRGGWKYLKAESKCQRFMWQIHYLSTSDLVRNCVVRFTVRLMPNKLRKIIYRDFIRNK